MKYQLKFYADSPDYRNKLFVFEVKDLAACNRLLSQFVSSGNVIKSAYWNSTDNWKKTMRLNLFLWKSSNYEILIPYLHHF